MKLNKYHALGNDYLVLDARDYTTHPTKETVIRICHRNYGLGSDGILWGPLPSEKALFRLAIFNPDGSEAEKSGNGLRIFIRFLKDQNLIQLGQSFTIETLGGVVSACFHSTECITVEMGKVSFRSDRIPVKGTDLTEVINASITLFGNDYSFCAATVGNPHVVLPMEHISAEIAHKLGPIIENMTDRFPNRTNVQFMKVIDRKNIQIEIWERGAGYTLASGSSSSAAGAVARKLNLVDSELTVHMPGGKINLSISEDFAITMTGPATRIGSMVIDPEALNVTVAG
jgi:diaminopimelate epimerase